ncbi:hypothetical protein EMPS_00773 [Entomortierella parvispora]|uniref:alpha-1,2-Mannosidase n=1 Tax=Entomortierella parvispora TaxID=205924 RepID=A0A9P3H1P9_9FUNG|nr:hypothetical protein EMPS_00773 [Entomortierella parvispora]
MTDPSYSRPLLSDKDDYPPSRTNSSGAGSPSSISSSSTSSSKRWISDPEMGLDPHAYAENPRLSKITTGGSARSSSIGSPITAAAVLTKPLSLFSSLRRVFRRNPTTVIGGRYTVSLRQLLGLLAVFSTLSFLSFLNGLRDSSSPAGIWVRDIIGPFTHRGPITYVYNAAALAEERANYLPLRYGLVHSPVDEAAVHDRYERVRGKGTQTSLKKIQTAFRRETRVEREERERRLQTVRDGFEHAWQGYRSYAWGHDEVKPVSGWVRDSFNGWGATIVDALDTLIIMGFNQEFDEAVEWVRTSLKFDKDPKRQLPFFETGIRYLGGLLSAYDLSGEKVLLDKAEELADCLMNAFQYGVFPTGLVTSDPKYTASARWFVLAEVGTIQLEFSRLSQLTGNPLYEQKALDVFKALAKSSTELPGLYPVDITENPVSTYTNYHATVGGGVDSAYEYLLKEWILLDGKHDLSRDMFLSTVDSIHKYMVSRPDTGSQEYAMLGVVSSKDKTINTQMGHLACFFGGSLAMSSGYFDRPEDLTLAKQITEACVLSYRSSVTGIGPEMIKFEKANADGTKFKVDPKTFYHRRSSSTEYLLRPETIESVWILYRMTGDKKYQDQAWEMFQSMERSCRTKIAYSGLRNVNRQGSYDDKMESFFFAETMKYYYLIFSTPDVISLDDFVLNTEAHPIRRM